MIILPTEEEKKKKVAAGGSQFSDVSAYLSQNQPQAQRLASSIGQNVVQAGNQARQTLGNTQNQFNQQLQTSRVPYNQDLANRAATDPRSFYNQVSSMPAQTNDKRKGGGGGRGGPNKQGDGRFNQLARYISQPQVSQPQDNSPINPDDIAAFQRMRDANYTGPMDLSGIEGFQDASNQEANAAKMTGQLDNAIGLQDLLKGVTGRASNPLDELLLGGGASKGILQNAGKENANIPGLTEMANKKAMEEALAAKTEADTTRENIGKSIYGEGGAFEALKGNIDKLGQQRGGGRKREAREMKQAEYQQTLDALNRLMGTDYQYGGV